MNILIDINHPAHVHLFKNVYHSLKAGGHQVMITVKDIEAARVLLRDYQMPYLDLGIKKDSKLGKGLSQLRYNREMLRIVRKFKIQLGLGSSITIPQVSVMSKMQSVIFDDDDDSVEPLFVRFGHAFANHILTPDVIQRKSSKSIYYSGTHELAYLHPNQFKPDPSVFSDLKLAPKDAYIILRFNAFKAHHDQPGDGLLTDQKIRLVNMLSQYGKVFITTEREIEPELREYQLPVKPENIHSVLYYAKAFMGDSQTMTSEAAILGTPALKCNTFAGKLSVPNELEQRYGLCYSYHPADFEAFYAHARELVQRENLKEEWRIKKERFLHDKIDVTSFFVWFIENYPASVQVMKETPGFQNQFK